VYYNITLRVLFSRVLVTTTSPNMLAEMGVFAAGGEGQLLERVLLE
jgi:hypothetical protein